MNEEIAVISSMNLYEYSQVNNEELGVLCGKRQGRNEFKDITFQVMRLIGIPEKEHRRWDVEDLDKPVGDCSNAARGRRSSGPMIQSRMSGTGKRFPQNQ